MHLKPCKDCVVQGITTNRPAPYPGPRCTTHHRLEKKRKSKNAHARRVVNNFGLTGVQYWALHEFQFGRCAICRRATGATKRLAVDHDHHLGCGHNPDKGCPKCARGLLCSVCNYDLIGRYDIEALQRAIDYLRDPPAQKFLKEWDERQPSQ